jgi:hypothetical protein
MYRTILAGGVAAAAIVGAGSAALAFGTTDSTSGTATVASAQTQLTTQRPLLGRDLRLLRHVAHGSVVTHGADGFVTHDLIVGHVTDVSATSITVRAADGVTQTYAVTSDTKVRVLGDGLTSIDKITTGDRAAVAGTGTSTLTAKHVVKLPS